MRILFILVILLSLITSHIFAQSSKIVGIQNLNSNNNFGVVSFDYVTLELDTILIYQNNYLVVAPDYSTAINPFTNTFYYGSTINNQSGIFDINLNNGNYSYKGNFTNCPHQVDFNPFTSDLIINDWINVKTLNTITGNVDILYTFPNNISIIYGNTQTFDFVNEILVIEVIISGNIYFITINLNSGEVLETQVSNSFIPIDIVYNPQNLKYYAHQNEDIYEVNPFTGNLILLNSIPNYSSLSDQQQSTFDPYNQKYLIPYLNTNNEYKLAIYDVINNIFDGEIDYFLKELDQFNSNLNPLLKLENNLLKTVKGESYEWFIDDLLLPNATTQYFQPDLAGIYKVNVTFPEDIKLFTNEIEITKDDILSENNIEIFPNPVNDDLTIKYISNYSNLQLFDITGKEILNIKNYKDIMKINLSHLESGLYYIRFLDDSLNLLSEQKIIVTH